MRKREKKYYNVGLAFILIMIVLLIILAIVLRTREYEYYKDGSFGISHSCFQTKKGQCYCIVNEKYEKVDSYYEK